jgi:peroxiredoxin
MATVTLAARALLALVFASAAVSKLPEPAASRKTFREFGVGARLARFAVLLAPTELGVVVGLIFVPTARWAALAAVLLLLIFITGMANALRLGRQPDCGCFGGFRPAPIGKWTLGRNGVLLVVAGLIAIAGPGPAVDQWLASHSAGTTALVAFLILGAATSLMHGARTASPGAGDVATQPFPGIAVPVVGDAAPDFSVTDTHGDQRTLSSLRTSGRPVVFVFANSDCGSCLSLFPDLARWQLTLAERLELVVVGGGDPDDVAHLCEQYRIKPALLDNEGTVSRLYGVHGTPAALALTGAGAIASGTVRGRDAIEDLIRLTLHRDEPILGTWNRTINAA